MDRSRWEPITEVLRMDACQMPARMPLLADHDRYSVLSVHGSVDTMRVKNGQLLGRLTFVEGDEDTDRIWNRVRQGHLRDLSVGYRVAAATECEPGNRCTVRGTEYQAPANMRLRVATDWTPRECSVVPIGADPNAKTRAAVKTEKKNMEPKYRALLERLGLRKEATEEEALTFAEKYTPPAPEAERTAPAADPPPVTTPPPAPAQPPDLAGERRAAAEGERRRIAELTRLGDGLPADVVRKAIDDGVSVADASVAFLTAFRANRTPPAGAPAIHTANNQPTVEALGYALAMRNVDGQKLLMRPDGKPREMCLARRSSIVGPDGKEAGPGYTIRRALNVDEHAKNTERALDLADRWAGLPLLDVCRLALQLEGFRVGFDSEPNEVYRTALSTAALQNIFTLSINAQFLVGYMDAADTTIGWVTESDVANFLTQERDTMGKFGALTKHAKGKKASDLDINDWKEEYKIYPYSGKFTVAYEDLVNDRFGAIASVAPMDMGLTAKQIRPNLVYSALLANAALDVDDTALFHANHDNLLTDVLSAEGLANGRAAIAKQRIRNRVLNLKPRYLLVPQDLWQTSGYLLGSTELYQSVTALASATLGGIGNANVIRELGLTRIMDDRLGAAGCWDPVAEVQRTGSATNWAMVCQPGEEGAKTIEVGYLRGTGRAPQIRSYVLDKGEWGIGWDVYFPIGVKALDFRAMVFSTGAGSGSGG